MENIVSLANASAAAAPAQGVSRLIDKVVDMPDGYLLSRENGEFKLQEDWRSHIAVIRNGNAHILVVSESCHASHRMFEVRRRMTEANMSNIRIMKATEDVIKLYYEEHQGVTPAGLAGESARTSVEDLAASVISEAADLNASDIHIEAKGNRANIFFRVNGTRVFHQEITAQTAHSLGTVLYSVYADANSKSSSWDPQQVMDGSIEWPISESRTYQLRFSSAPIHPSGGFHIVIRMLSMEAKGKDLDALGYSPQQKSALDIMIAGSSGMIVVCGPTNSGKSTSLQALMKMIYDRRGDTIKMITVEDPVEYVIPGACQISVPRGRKNLADERTGSNFTTFLRGTLRQDPDVVMVGEIRDHDSASVVKDLVLAGRKILATLHTYSALWAFMRMREIGIPWEVLTMPNFIAGIVYQRLVPVLCKECSIHVRDGADRIHRETLYRIQQVSDLSKDNVRVRGDGCSHCNHTGISGQTVCAEFVLPDRTLLKYLSEGSLLEAERYWMNARVGANANGGVTALSHAIEKMRNGIVSPIDVEERISLLTSDMVNADSMITDAELAVLSGQGKSLHYNLNS